MNKIPAPIQDEMDALCERAGTHDADPVLILSAGVCILSLKTERDQLKAQINRFKSGIEVMSESGIDELLYEIDDETPAQSLLLHDAEVLERIITDCGMSLEDAKGKYNPSLSTGFLLAKATNLRQQALENKS